ncbi:sugar kinase [Cryobacterium arcticum]|uniref:Sugar kinase n=2 Tax=Cryobacterium arcticum TaxID=670052 RepID=A0A1B1BP68_9MICO|nr:sugar kinase [Cryobacterium arcticum]
MALLRAETPAPLAHVHELALGIGGAESNLAIALARLGTPVSWVGRVGADSLGERVLRELRAEGLDVHGTVDPEALTGLMIKERRTSDTVKVWYYRSGSAGSRLTPADVAPGLIEEATLLHVTGISLALSDSARDTVLSAVARAQAAGVPVSFDVNHRASLWCDRDAAAAAYREVAASATMVFAGEDEARLLTGADETASVADLARSIAALGPDQVLIKLGADGCLALVDGTEHRQAAVPVRVVDTVGAGDAFVAGYLAELVAGRPVAERLRTAVTTGAFACLTPGDWEGMPRRHELALLHQAEPVSR